MLNNYFTLHHLSLDLDARLQHRHIAEIFSQTRDTCVVTFHDFPESLIISCRPDLNVLYLHPHYTRAKSNTVGVLTACWGREILSVATERTDRIVTMALDGNLSLHIHFFGSVANIVLVNPEQRIVDAFRNRKKYVGTQYEPTPQRLPPSGRTLYDIFQSLPSLSVDEALKNAFPHLGSLVVQEALFRSHLSASCIAEQLPLAESQQLERVLDTLHGELSHPRPRIYRRSTDSSVGTTGHRHREVPPSSQFSIIPLQHLHGYDEQTFDDIHEAVRSCVSFRESAKNLTSQKAALLAPLARYLERTQKTVHALQQDLDKHSRSDQWERYGSLLMAHITTLQRGIRTAAIGDVHGDVEIPLDPSLTPLENAQQYFSRAKRSRHAHGEIQTRLEQLDAQTVIAEKLHSALSSITTREDLKKFMGDHKTELNHFGVHKERDAQMALPFRAFTVDGGFEVLAGKSSKNNDLLTLKHTKPNDLWFHARGSSGSHVVLKVGSAHGEPSKKAKEQAASIAAYYSKSRNAKMVPVAMTERKYVRKPKGAPPGTVVLEREKVIFAEPALPGS